MNAMAEERRVFENEEWLVTERGLEHKDTGYFIERESIANRRSDGLWTWPMHMAEKSWCRMMPFAEAFSCAASVYRIETGPDLAQTFRIARCEIAPWPTPDKQAGDRVYGLPRTLQNEAPAPILWEPHSPKKPLRELRFSSQDSGVRFPFRIRRDPSFPAQERLSRLGMAAAAAFPWRAPRRIRKTGTKLVRLIQAALIQVAWNIR